MRALPFSTLWREHDFDAPASPPAPTSTRAPCPIGRCSDDVRDRFDNAYRLARISNLSFMLAGAGAAASGIGIPRTVDATDAGSLHVRIELGGASVHGRAHRAVRKVRSRTPRTDPTRLITYT